MPKMSIIRIVVFVLIAEIFISTNARSAEDKSRSLCTKNGTPWVYQALRDTFTRFERCYRPVLNEVLREIERVNGAMNTALTMFCGKAETLRRCVKSATDTVKSCLRPHQHETIIEVVYNVAAPVLQYFCKNSKDLGNIFNRLDVQTCIASKLQAVKYCKTKIIVRDHDTRHDRVTPETDPFTVLSLLENKFNSQDCSEVQSFEQCSLKVLEECEDQGFWLILDTLYKYINNDIPCKDLPKSPKSEASPNSVVNALILSIPVTIAMSL